MTITDKNVSEGMTAALYEQYGISLIELPMLWPLQLISQKIRTLMSLQLGQQINL